MTSVPPHPHQDRRDPTRGTSPWGWPAVTYSLGIGEGPQPVVVLLPRRVPQPQVDRFAVHHHIRRVVVETAGAEREESA